MICLTNFFSFFFFFFFFFFVNQADGDWVTAGNWSPATGAPPNTDTEEGVINAAGKTVLIDTPIPSPFSPHAVVNAGTLNVKALGVTLKSLTISGTNSLLASSMSSSGVFTVETLSIPGGRVNLGNNDIFAVTQAATFSNSFIVTGAGNNELRLTGIASTPEFGSGEVSIKTVVDSNVLVNDLGFKVSGVFTQSGSKTFTIDTDSSFEAGSGATVTLRNVVNSGTFLHNAGGLTMNSLTLNANSITTTNRAFTLNSDLIIPASASYTHTSGTISLTGKISSAGTTLFSGGSHTSATTQAHTISAGTFTVSGGTLTINSGTSTLSVGGQLTVSSGGLTARVVTVTSGTITHNGGTLSFQAVTNAGTINLQNPTGSSFSCSSLSSTGQFNLKHSNVATTTGPTTIQTSTSTGGTLSATTLSLTGTISLTNTAFSGSVSTVISNTGAVTLNTGATLGVTAAPLTINAGGSLSMNAGNVNNNLANVGGTLTVSGGSFTISSLGDLTALSGSTVSVTGGTVSVGDLDIQTTSFSQSGGTINSGALLKIAASSTYTQTGGSISATGGNILGSYSVSGTSSLSIGGNLQISNSMSITAASSLSFNNIVVASSSTFTYSTGVIATVSGNIGITGALNQNAGKLDGGSTTTVTINSNGAYTLTNAAELDANAISVSTSATLSLSNTAKYTAGSTTSVSGLVDQSGGIASTGALTVNSGGTFRTS